MVGIGLFLVGWLVKIGGERWGSQNCPWLCLATPPSASFPIPPSSFPLDLACCCLPHPLLCQTKMKFNLCPCPHICATSGSGDEWAVGLGSGWDGLVGQGGPGAASGAGCWWRPWWRWHGHHGSWRPPHLGPALPLTRAQYTQRSRRGQGPMLPTALTLTMTLSTTSSAAFSSRLGTAGIFTGLVASVGEEQVIGHQQLLKTRWAMLRWADTCRWENNRGQAAGKKEVW